MIQRHAGCESANAGDQAVVFRLGKARTAFENEVANVWTTSLSNF